jgi:PHD/YefM family antitoxin component YafN of YafNO toxin-antitoxin module
MVKSMQRLVSIPKEDLESLEATIETLQNEYVMEQLKKSEIDIRRGKVRNIEKFIKELKEGQ